MTFPIITICGSMRFKDIMLDCAKDFTENGWIVLAPFSAQKGYATKQMLDEMHFTKIDMSQAIVVVSDSSKYHGESTRREIMYALDRGVNILEYVSDKYAVKD